jgi:glutathione S-transferase
MSYRLLIGNKNTSSWSLRPWIALRRAQLPFSEVDIVLRAPDAKAQILRHSPSGKVPALLLGERVMDFLARTPKSSLADPVAADVRRIVALWRDSRARFGAGGPFLFGPFTAADAMYAPVTSRFRTYLPNLSAYGDDGVAQAYVETLFATPEMAAWEAGARQQTGAA